MKKNLWEQDEAKAIKQWANRYNRRWPKRPPLVIGNLGEGHWLYGVWIMGNDYRSGTRFYGAYPGNYLERIMIMFGSDKKNILHLFSGSLPKGKYIRFDLKQKADVKGDAQKLSSYFPKQTPFDLIIADPPYSKTDANKYGTSMINRNKVLQECSKVLCSGGHLVWLDTVFPMFKKIRMKLVGNIGLIVSTNHRFRMVSIFERTERKGNEV